IFWNEFGSTFTDAGHGWNSHFRSINIPLVGQIRFDRHAAAITMRNHMAMSFDLSEIAALFHHRYDGFASLEAIQTFKRRNGCLKLGTLIETFEEILIVAQSDLGLIGEDRDKAQTMAF